MAPPRTIITIALMIAAGLALTACGGSSEPAATFKAPPDVYAAVVKRLEDHGQVLHAVVTSIQSGNSTPATYEFWIDEANDVAKEHKKLVTTADQEIIVADGKRWYYANQSAPTSAQAPNCEGVTAPATSLLLSCYGLAGSHTALASADGKALRIVTTGSYGTPLDNKPWSITLTLDAGSLLPISGESDLWAVLNGQPYEAHETSSYTTAFINRDSLPADFFAVK